MVKYSTQIKDVLRELVEKGLTQKEIANELDVSRSTIKRWLKKEKLKTKGNIPKYIGRHCVECDEPIVAVNQYAIYCSDECSQRVRNRETRKNARSVCKECGVTFKGWNYSYCDDCKLSNVKHKKLAGLLEKLQRIKTCVNCGEKFFADNLNKKICQKNCKKIYSKECIQCGNGFDTQHNGTLYCSDRCSNRFHSKRSINKRYKLAKQNGEIDWSISLEKLIRKENNRCYLCGEDCNSNDYIILDNGTIVTGKTYPSIEHVVPISKGGTHTWDNVRLAHRYCNSKKGNKIPTPVRNF